MIVVIVWAKKSRQKMAAGKSPLRGLGGYALAAPLTTRPFAALLTV